MLCVNQTGIIQELDNLHNHKISMRMITSEKSMDDQTFEHLTVEDNGLKITLEFPCSPQDNSIISEVKSVLEELLNEYLENVS